MNISIYRYIYHTPDSFDDMLMSSDGNVLTGLWFQGSPDQKQHTELYTVEYLPVFKETCRWLDIYFSGRQPAFTPIYQLNGLTTFRGEVSEILCTIPVGKTMTYGDIAAKVAPKHGILKMSAQAVGGAVGWNPIGIIIPCHRVIGAGGKLTGYGGGIKNKIALLELEGNDMSEAKL